MVLGAAAFLIIDRIQAEEETANRLLGGLIMADNHGTLVTLSSDQVKRVAVIVDRQETFWGLLSTGYTTAQMHDAYLVVLVVAEEPPTWLEIPENYDSSRIILEVVSDKAPARRIIKIIKQIHPMLLGLSMETAGKGLQSTPNEMFDSIIQQVPCPIYLLKCKSGWSISSALSAFVPFWDDANTRFAIDTALGLNPSLKITAGIVVPPSVEPEDLINRKNEFADQTSKWHSSSRFTTKILQGFNEQQCLLDEAEGYDFMLFGTSRGNLIASIFLGAKSNKLAIAAKGPVITFREYQGKPGATMAGIWSQANRLLPTLDQEDRIEAYRLIRRGGRPTRDFFSMTALSAAIASLGLILDSAAVIIGAMLVAPLMSAIIGMGMAIIHGDMRFLLVTSTAVVKGTVIAVFTGFVFGLVNFHGEATAQILQRTSPSILDLLVALISGVAAAYALCRKNVSNSLPGVAIAVALVPPLATVGVCLSIGYWGLAIGAFKLFTTNLVAIVFASALVFASFGFRPNQGAAYDDRKIKVFQRSFLATGLLVLLMLVLLATKITQGIQEANLDEEVRSELRLYLSELAIPATVQGWNMEEVQADTTRFDLQLHATRALAPAEVEALRERLAEAIGTPIALNLEMIPVTIIQSEKPGSEP